MADKPKITVDGWHHLHSRLAMVCYVTAELGGKKAIEKVEVEYADAKMAKSAQAVSDLGKQKVEEATQRAIARLSE